MKFNNNECSEFSFRDMTIHGCTRENRLNLVCTYGMTVDIAVHSNSLDSQTFACVNHTTGNLSTISDKDFVKFL